MGWVWVTVGVITGLVIGMAALFDRRIRKHGHRVRRSGDVQGEIRERRREFRGLGRRDPRRRQYEDLGRPVQRER
ncbi:MAG: hypothetical protein JWP76_5141 [Dactylosporangium sp.]|jgi:hypothetical protein|nr:hypothetical protein [Dactylosporangium sp.]